MDNVSRDAEVWVRPISPRDGLDSNPERSCHLNKWYGPWRRVVDLENTPRINTEREIGRCQHGIGWVTKH